MNMFWDVTLRTFVYIWIIVPPEHCSYLPNYIASHSIRHQSCYVSFVNCPNFFNTKGNSKKQSNKHCDAENFMLILMYTWYICSKLYQSDHGYLSIFPTVSKGLVSQIRRNRCQVCAARCLLASWRLLKIAWSCD
jgi:hypothetical protein